MADFHRRDSFLKNAGSFGSFLDVNNLPKIPKGAFDLDYKIKETEAGRPDILAGNLYENPRLWWVFALRNPDILKDPLEDFKAGVNIKIPSPEDVKALLG
tara:strand:- start:3920 stop:4219 length:300 start_codon:yes stop_codon:yes gene_type:complete